MIPEQIVFVSRGITVISLSYKTRIFSEFNKLDDAVLYCATLGQSSSYLALFVDLKLVTRFC